MTMSQQPSLLLWGEGRSAAVPRYWVAALVASDDSVDIALTIEPNPAAPQGLGGECLFVNWYLTVKAAAGATLRVTPIVDDTEPASLATMGSGTVSPVPASVTITQQTGGPPVPMVTLTFQVPILFQLTRGGVVQSRWYARGARIAPRIESVGPIGTGSFHVDALELEYEPLVAIAKGAVQT